MSFKRIRRVTNHFQQSGLRRLGSGAYGEVWSKDDRDSVYKIGTYDHKDPDGWFYFASWLVNNNINNPYFLQIKSLSGRPTFYIAEIEKLSETRPDLEDKYNSIRCNFSDAVYKFRGPENWRQSWLNNSYETDFEKDAWFIADPDFWEAMDILKTAYNDYEKTGVRLNWDTHAGNCMYRDAHQLVITDPWTMREYSCYSTEFRS